MQELDFKDWLYEEGFFGSLAKKIPMFALGGALAVGLAGVGAERYFRSPAAPMPKVKVDPSRLAVRIPKGGFEFRIQGYGKVEPEQIRIPANGIRAKGLSNIALQTAIKTPMVGGVEGIKEKIAGKLNAQSSKGYGYSNIPSGKEVDMDNVQQLGNQNVTVVLEDAPIYAGTPFDPIYITGSIDLNLGEGSWIAPAK